MKETPQANSGLKSWGAATFVIAVLFVVWGLALLRLHRHANGEVFLHWSGAVDSLMAIVAPLAIVGRILQTKKARKEVTA